MFFVLIKSSSAWCQTISGTLKDKATNEPLIGATVIVKGTTNGTTTDLDGNFQLLITQPLPIILVCTYVGYNAEEISVSDASQKLKIKLGANQINLKVVNVTDSRITERQKESPLTVETMDMIAIKQTPAANFYEGLGQLKGVDLTSASIGFKVINTRGFNSTSPVRSLQIIDGVDNQAPGLNFSLGNFLGASELDVLKVELVAGASSAYYGPNAFNGVINMSSRSPFIKPGLEVMAKVGERNLLETSVRYAFVLKNKKGIEKFGAKFNVFAMRANDWEADNLSPTPQSRNDAHNQGGYDAVNVYGDEYNRAGDLSKTARSFPGLGTFYRTGYHEKDLVDYNTENLKLGTALHYRLQPETEIILASNFGAGTTVYQGDNRYSLKDITFFQNRIEIKKYNKYFLRFYATNENAGKSYDAFFTALLLQRAVKNDVDWNQDYRNYWATSTVSQTPTSIAYQMSHYPGFPQAPVPSTPESYIAYINSINPFLIQNYYDSLIKYHALARMYADGYGGVSIYNNSPFLVPGTNRFDTAFAGITSRETFAQGGSKFYDKSALYHAHGEYKFTPRWLDITVGANFRAYRPNSNGTIFSDTAGFVIKNNEWGAYAGLEKRILSDKLKLNATTRVDKNDNFNYLWSPAFSAVYTLNKNHTWRAGFSSAIRNPTLSDQYLYYQVGRAILVGNLTGFDSLVTIPSLLSFYNTQNKDSLVYFNVRPVVPEKVKTIEVGYRTTLFNHIYMDAGYYYSIYKDFIGYEIGADIDYITSANSASVNNVYRVATNSLDKVTTQGFSVAMNYYFSEFYTLSGNYSWNELNRKGSDDPLIPAYNTPKNKFNIGLSARYMQTNFTLLNRIWKKLPSIPIHNWGFNINYKWVQGFLFEGSPQFTGEIKNYDLLDLQINKRITKLKTTVKIGAANLLSLRAVAAHIAKNNEYKSGEANIWNNKHYEVFGGPQVGRLAYVQILVELN